MFKMSFPVVLVSCKVAKDEKQNNYADFLFTGGNTSIVVDNSAFEQLKSLVNEEFIASFQLKPRSIILFGRSVLVFEPIKFLEICK